MRPFAVAWLCLADGVAAADAPAPAFTQAQPKLSSPRHALSKAFADVDGDRDPDLAVSFTDGAIRLYLNEGGRFAEAGSERGLPQQGPEIRALAWGDYDRDGDLDLFSAQRSSRNRLWRNDGSRFTDVSEATGLDDPRRTVGACWFDMDEDGDLDVFIANQEADKDAFYRNDGGRFTDVAPQLDMNQPARTLAEGGVGCAVGDYDNDGLLDLYVATYGHALLYRNLGGGNFREAAAEAGLRRMLHAVGASWGDVDNDGLLDLYVAAYEDTRSRGLLLVNRGGRFVDALAEDSPLRASDHGTQWTDVDRDGDLDLSLTETFPDDGRHRLFLNELPADEAPRSLQVMPLDREGHATQAGAEVRLFTAEGKLLGTRLVPTGDGYGSQSVIPVHFGLGDNAMVTVEVTFLTRDGRKRKRLEYVDPRGWSGRSIEVRAD